MISVNCPNCGNRHDAPPNAAGLQTKCRVCSAPMIIPGPVARYAPPPSAPDEPFDFVEQDLQEHRRADERPPFSVGRAILWCIAVVLLVVGSFMLIDALGRSTVVWGIDGPIHNFSMAQRRQEAIMVSGGMVAIGAVFAAILIVTRPRTSD